MPDREESAGTDDAASHREDASGDGSSGDGPAGGGLAGYGSSADRASRDGSSGNGEAASAGTPSTERVRHVTGVEPGRVFDHDKIRDAVRMLFEAIGEDLDREGLEGTPDRVARLFDEVFAGVLIDPADVVSAVFEEGHDELVLVREIPFHSLCEHHLLPWFGEAHVGYLPNDRGQITGLSKLARLVDVCAKRPGVQERMTTMIADTLEKALSPRGVIVVLEARHLCMEMRGIRKPEAVTVTSTVRGTFRSDPRTRAEAMTLIQGRG